MALTWQPLFPQGKDLCPSCSWICPLHMADHHGMIFSGAEWQKSAGMTYSYTSTWWGLTSKMMWGHLAVIWAQLNPKIHGEPQAPRDRAAEHTKRRRQEIPGEIHWHTEQSRASWSQGLWWETGGQDCVEPLFWVQYLSSLSQAQYASCKVKMQLRVAQRRVG